MSDYLPFERPLYELLAQIDALKGTTATQIDGVSLSDDIERLERRADEIRRRLYEKLTPWQVTQIARHPRRPHTSDYIRLLFEEFVELRGDRTFAEDRAVLCGLARFQGQALMVIGHEKGRALEERLVHNFGMPKPEGYRKAKRMMELAERMGLPVFTLIDTPGAYPGIDAEERGQSEAIASSIERMSRLRVPVISCVIGEGGSGGALAIGVCDHLMMLSNTTYSVISPEGCAAILWKDATQAEKAAVAMKITPKDLLGFKLIDELVEEPVGGAHEFPTETAVRLGEALSRALKTLTRRLVKEGSEAFIEARYQKLLNHRPASLAKTR